VRPSRIFNPTRLREVRFFRRWLRSRPSGRVCDVGCGDGYYSLLIGGNREIHGFDPFAAQVKQAAASAARRSPPTSFLIADARHMPYATGSFDAVVSLCVLEHVPEVEKAFCEANRIVRRGGLFLFTVDSLNERHIPEAYRAYHRNRFYVAAFLDANRIAELLHANGFERLQCVSLVRNRLSGALFRLFAQRYAVYRWVSPLACLALLLSDCMWGPRDEGYCLMVAARKP